MKLALVIGTRPQIIKSSPVIKLAQDMNEIELQIVHTGQHYDYKMSKIFFDEVCIPDPDINLGIGSGTHAEQTGKMIISIEKALMKLKPDMVLIPGDTNSTLSASLVAAKLKLAQSHLEAGARIYDLQSPEEINRVVVDHVSSLLLTPCENFSLNLKNEGIDSKKIHQVGDTMYDALKQNKDKFLRRQILDELKLEGGSFSVLTLHRSENTDDPQFLTRIAQAVLDINDTIVFPAHPRVHKNLTSTGFMKKIDMCKHIKMIEPLSYLDMMKLVSEAKVVMTDSGGLQKEAFWLSTPCITLRESTEWVETIQLKANFLVGTNIKSIVDTFHSLADESRLKSNIRKIQNPYGDGNAAEKTLKSILDSDIWNKDYQKKI